MGQRMYAVPSQTPVFGYDGASPAAGIVALSRVVALLRGVALSRGRLPLRRPLRG